MLELQNNNPSISFSENLLKGEDGGYYTPSISGNKISWKASKAGMPKISDFVLDLKAEDISYSHSKLTATQQKDGVKGALNYLLAYTPHTHSNISALNRLSTDTSSTSTNLYINSKSNKIALESKTLTYNSNPPTTLFMVDNTNYILKGVKTLSISFPATPLVPKNRLFITFSAEGDISVTFPSNAQYVGEAPQFKNGETWEIFVVNKVIHAWKLGDGKQEVTTDV